MLLVFAATEIRLYQRVRACEHSLVYLRTSASIDREALSRAPDARRDKKPFGRRREPRERRGRLLAAAKFWPSCHFPLSSFPFLMVMRLAFPLLPSSYPCAGGAAKRVILLAFLFGGSLFYISVFSFFSF